MKVEVVAVPIRVSRVPFILWALQVQAVPQRIMLHAPLPRFSGSWTLVRWTRRDGE